MYSACLFCHARLGANEVVERFPVGRRLAFDAARGRLWVLCTGCGRWNLTPLEERWEAIEECERRYRESRIRVSTDNIGMARVPEGLELVRVGRPLRPEMAAWRYGRLINRRYFRAAGWKALGALAAGVATGGVVAGVVSLPALFALAAVGGPVVALSRGGTVVERVRVPGGTGLLLVERRDLREVRVLRDDDAGWALSLPHRLGVSRLTGAAADSVLARILVHVNRGGASEDDLGIALRRMGDATDAGRLMRDTAVGLSRIAHMQWVAEFRSNWWGRSHVDPEYPTLADVDRSLRVAMEMALHEDAERRAAEGELATLEAAWRDAEEIAAIADGLLLPPAVTRRLAVLRGEAAPPA